MYEGEGERVRMEDGGWRMRVRLEVRVGLGGRNWRENDSKKMSSPKKSSQCRKIVEWSDLTRKSHLKVVSYKTKIYKVVSHKMTLLKG